MKPREYPIWRKPQHHLNLEKPDHHVHWVELFFDLIHVVTIFLLGGYLSHHLDLHGFLVFAGLFVALFYAWTDSAVYNSLFVSTDILHRVIMALQIVTVMFVAASITSVTGEGWPYFALAYGANRALTALLYARARGHAGGAAQLAYEMSRNFGILAVFFALSAFLPKPAAFWVFGLTLVAVQLQFMLPKIGTLRLSYFTPRMGHIVERFGLIMLILLGEGFFKLVVTLSEEGISHAQPEVLLNMATGGVGLFAMAWIYFDSIGNAPVKIGRPTETWVKYWMANIVLMLSTVMVGVALAGEVHVGFWDPYPAKYGMIGVPGLILFLGAIWYLQSLVDERDVTRRYTAGMVRMLGIATAVLLFFIIDDVPAIVGNLLFGFALASQILIPLVRILRDIRNGAV